MKHVFEPFVIRRFAQNRVFFVNAEMPFEMFLDCFQIEQPFFMVSHLRDGRIAITPNATVIPQNLLQAGFGPEYLLPTAWEYVTVKSNYPLIITAHPVTNVDEWMKAFERCVIGFCRQTLSDFVTTTCEFIPLKTAWRTSKTTRMVAEPVATD